MTKLIGHTWNERPGISPAIVAAKEFVSDRRWSGSIDRQPYWILDYVISPFGKYRVGSDNDPWKERPAHTLILYQPDMQYYEDTFGTKEALHSAWILFQGGEAAGLSPIVHPRGYAVFTDDDGIMQEAMTEVVMLGHQNGERSFWKAQQILIRAIDLLFGARLLPDGHHRISADTNQVDSNFVNNAEVLLRQHLLEDVDVPHIAGHMNMSESGFYHRFKRETGTTPFHVMNKMKIEHTKALLVRGQPLKIIAHELGFCDEFHLSKTFKRIEGIAPREYLRNVRGNDSRTARQ